MGLLVLPSFEDMKFFRDIIMGAKGSSSVDTHVDHMFRTNEGWEQYRRRMDFLHGMATKGQEEAIIREVREWEDKNIVGLQQENEYNEAMRANELYEKLVNGGK